MSWASQAERDAGTTCAGCLLIGLTAAIMVGGLVAFTLWLARVVQ